MLVTLRRILKEVQAARDLDEALMLIVRLVKQAIPIDACAVYLADRNHYTLMAADGLHAGAIGRVRLGLDEGIVGWVGERRELINLANAASHPRYLCSSDTGEDRYAAVLGVPLIHYHRVLGVLVAWKSAPSPFDKEDVALFVTLAAQLAKVIHEATALGNVLRQLSGEASDSTYIQGIQAAPGVAVGTIALLDPQPRLTSVANRRPPDRQAEAAAFACALNATREELNAISARLAGELPDEELALFDVYVKLLESDSLTADTLQRIQAGNWAPGAWRDTIADHARVFENMDDHYLRARAEDIRDLGDRVLTHLQARSPATREYPKHCILMGEAVGITDIAAVPFDRLCGIVSQHGSALSHTAVMARALGIAAVTSLSALPLGRLDGRAAVVDGNRGRIHIRPSRSVLRAYRQHLGDERDLTARLQALHALPAITPDAVRIPLHVNIGLVDELPFAQASGGEGIGLFRTEFPFLIRESLPVEEEQYPLYRRVLKAFAPKPVTIRTLDVGGDKILSYLPVEEENPSLGCRGIRFTLDHPEIFLMQLRALLRANAGLNNLQLLFPMISKVGEVDETLGLLARAHRELLEEGVAAAKARVGVMIEVPSAVYLAEALARRVDFLSIGTNDLTQYLLAVDRNNAEVATPYDSLHPAVINAVHQVIEGAHRQRTPVSVCGEMAGDPASALLLLGMGADSLSMNPTSLARIKWVIRSFTQRRARELLDEALAMEDGFDVQELLDGALEEAGLGVLVRSR